MSQCFNTKKTALKVLDYQRKKLSKKLLRISHQEIVLSTANAITVSTEMYFPEGMAKPSRL